MTGGNLENFSSASEWAGRLDARRFDDDRESIGASKLHGRNLFNYRSEAWLETLAARGVGAVSCFTAGHKD